MCGKKKILSGSDVNVSVVTRMYFYFCGVYSTMVGDRALGIVYMICGALLSHLPLPRCSAPTLCVGCRRV